VLQPLAIWWLVFGEKKTRGVSCLLMGPVPRQWLEILQAAPERPNHLVPVTGECRHTIAWIHTWHGDEMAKQVARLVET